MTMIIMDKASVDQARFTATLQELGVLAYAAANRIGIFPPLIIGDGEIDRIVDSISRAAVLARR
jgi:adenosylmethionine-8-amino-7-oxononanoate aminotransferase